MELIEKTKESTLIFDGKVVHLYCDTVTLPNGGESIREYVKHVGAVCVIPVTDSGDVILEKQYRYAVGETLIEIPAGKLDSAEENPYEAALRELREETGIIPDELIELGIYYGSPAIMGEKIHMYMARGLQFGKDDLDADEFLEVFTIPLQRAVELVLQGKITDGKTQTALLRAKMMIERGL
ncbi:MAG: NUDIX hydrolase [Clostridia bacterium]|nr:NUDIX hydrolase [Clostridia bacterium]MBQ8235416.1 NUDIX hydrolase [Clostridia bacterium]MBQ8399053.1 NUDIX hydrolase [Clostridia bacterium]